MQPFDSNVQVQLVLAKLDTINARLETIGAHAPSKEPQATTKDPWWLTLTKFLGLPAAAIALVMNLTTVRHDNYDTEKIAAETAKLRTDELKTRADLAQQLDVLDKSRVAGTAAYRAELEAALPKIEQSLARLRLINESVRLTDTSVLYKSLLIGTFASTVWLGLSVASTAWESILPVLLLGVFRARDGKTGRRMEGWRRRLPLIISVTSPLIAILKKWLEIFLFTLLTVPVFNLAARALGSDLTLQELIGDLTHLRLGTAAAKVHELIVRQ